MRIVRIGAHFEVQMIICPAAVQVGGIEAGREARQSTLINDFSCGLTSNR